MVLRIHNTLTRCKEEFKPIRKGKVGMYVCGVTVYDECHLGHARAYVSFDVIVRYLEFSGYEVRYIRNVTDVDDKIIARAKKQGQDFTAIAERYYQEFVKQMTLLGLKPPTSEPRATKHISEMIALIGRLLENGIAYTVQGDVFFEVGKFKGYGKLSKRELEEMIAGARVEVNDHKRNPLDFTLWKAAKPDEPSWDSPWGKGRPGWHIECSAMSMKLLGETFDIHGGGQDLIFPHHENEIAQSCGATGKPFVGTWIHNGFVMFQKHKMSKSLGNIFTLSQLFEKFLPAVVKFFLLTKHYRSPMDFDLLELEEAKKNLEKIDNAIGLAYTRLEEKGTSAPAAEKLPTQREHWNDSKALGDFCDAMDEDFNTPRALALIHDLLGKIYGNIHSDGQIEELSQWLQELLMVLKVLGVPYKPHTMARFSEGVELSNAAQEKLLKSEELTESDIIVLIKARNFARGNKNFMQADRIRQGMEAKGIVLRDEKGGTTWVRHTAKAN